MIFQDPYASLNPRHTVADIVGEPLDVYGLVNSRKERGARVHELLELVGLDPRFGQRYPHEFSGGQRQRVGIARALATEPSLLICDEPTSALDVSIQAQIITLLERLQNQLGLTYLFIAHDLAMVKYVATRIAVMYMGRIVETAATAELFRNPRHPYTRSLISAVPVPDPRRERAREHVMLQGDPPSPSDPPSGCRFRGRCFQAQERCRAEDPALMPLEGSGHAAACWFPLNATRKVEA